jgi:hypothetical protein
MAVTTWKVLQKHTHQHKTSTATLKVARASVLGSWNLNVATTDMYNNTTTQQQNNKTTEQQDNRTTEQQDKRTRLRRAAASEWRTPPAPAVPCGQCGARIPWFRWEGRIE